MCNTSMHLMAGKWHVAETLVLMGSPSYTCIGLRRRMDGRSEVEIV